MTKLFKTKVKTGKLSNGDIKTHIESELCPVHRERPVVTIVDENDIDIYGCCRAFEDRCREEIHQILLSQKEM